ncbi:membrane protein insertion efficiency factor YidD [Candidatus Woesebacteria bacterium]|nr:membrane protein insertion efficiency factor YidD [Candidatus Woesebacteria bacterium]
MRYNLLRSVFGVVIHCKHSPTCGTYAFRQIQKRGIFIGGFRGLLRVITCW